MTILGKDAVKLAEGRILEFWKSVDNEPFLGAHVECSRAIPHLQSRYSIAPSQSEVCVSGGRQAQACCRRFLYILLHVGLVSFLSE